MDESREYQKLLSVSEVSRLTGVSVRTLHYYDAIGLLPPTEVTPAGYRLYDEAALYRLQCILLYRELEFSLREISDIMGGSDFDMIKALERQIELLQRKKTHIENLITLAQGIKVLGVNQLDFSEFDVKKIDEYERQAKETWGTTPEYQEYARKTAGWSEEDYRSQAMGLMNIIAETGQLRTSSEPSDEIVQAKVRELQDYITENYYTCSDDVLLSLGRAYSGGGSMQHYIDKRAGEGTAEFVTQAIEYYYSNKQ